MKKYSKILFATLLALMVSTLSSCVFVMGWEEVHTVYVGNINYIDWIDNDGARINQGEYYVDEIQKAPNPNDFGNSKKMTTSEIEDYLDDLGMYQKAIDDVLYHVKNDKHMLMLYRSASQLYYLTK